MPRTHLQVVLDSVADEDAVLEQIGDLLLHVLER